MTGYVENSKGGERSYSDHVEKANVDSFQKFDVEANDGKCITLMVPWWVYLP